MTYERIPIFYISFINCDDMGEHTIAMEMEPGSTADDARWYFMQSQHPDTRILIVSVYDADYIEDLYKKKAEIPNEIARYLRTSEEDMHLLDPNIDPNEPEGEPYTDWDYTSWGFYDDNKNYRKKEDDDEDDEGEEWKKLL